MAAIPAEERGEEDVAKMQNEYRRKFGVDNDLDFAVNMLLHVYENRIMGFTMGELLRCIADYCKDRLKSLAE